MKRTKHAQIHFALAALISATVLAACGSQKSSTGGSTPLTGNVGKTNLNPGQPSKARLKILNAEALKKIQVDGDTHEFYAVQGQIVERAKVDQMVGQTPNLVACEVKTANFEFQNGDLATPVMVTPSISQRDVQVHVVTIAPSQEQAQQQAQAQAQNQAQQQNQFMLSTFEIICMKANAPMSSAEIASALQGIVQIN